MNFILHENVRLNIASISSYYPWGPLKTSSSTKCSIILCFHGDKIQRHFFFDSEEQRDEFLNRLDALVHLSVSQELTNSV